MPRMLYINCSGPTSRSRTLSNGRPPSMDGGGRRKTERRERTFVGRTAEVTQPHVRTVGHRPEEEDESRKLRKGESMRASHPSDEQIRPRISDSAKGSRVERGCRSRCVKTRRS